MAKLLYQLGVKIHHRGRATPKFALKITGGLVLSLLIASMVVVRASNSFSNSRFDSSTDQISKSQLDHNQKKIRTMNRPTSSANPKVIQVLASELSEGVGTASVIGPKLSNILIPHAADGDLTSPAKKDVAMQLVSSAENSSLDWKAQYGYIEDIKDGRGYTAGIIGFCSGTGDMLALVQHYSKLDRNNVLAKYLPVLEKLNGSPSHAGLDPKFVTDWKAAAKYLAFQQAQNDERDRVYFNPAVSQAKLDGLHALGQFIYYDAIVMHGPGDDPVSFGGIRVTALGHAKSPSQGGDETAFLWAYLDARVAAMKTEAAHDNVDRVEAAQRLFLKAGNLDLRVPLSWMMYGEPYTSN